MKVLESKGQQIRVYPAGHAYLDYDYEEGPYPLYACPQKSVSHKGHYNASVRVDLILSPNKEKVALLFPRLPEIAPELLEFYRETTA